jgi:hypothetical protein
VLTAVPCASAPEPTVVWAATASLSLLWTLQWLATDQVNRGHVEGNSTELSPRLRHTLRCHVPDPDVLRPDAVRGRAVDWSSLNVHSGTQGWLDRLATALDVPL